MTDIRSERVQCTFRGGGGVTAGSPAQANDHAQVPVTNNVHVDNVNKINFNVNGSNNNNL